MFNRVEYKETAKREMHTNHNRSGMIGAQFFYEFVSDGMESVVLAALSAAITAISSFTIFGSVSSLASTLVSSMFSGGRIGLDGLFGGARTIVLLILLVLLSPVLQAVKDAITVPMGVGLARYYLSVKKNGTRPRVISILEGLDHFWDIVILAVARWFYVVRWPWLLSFGGGLISGIIMVVGIITGSNTGLFLGLLLYILVIIAATIWTYIMNLKMWPFIWVVADHPQLSIQQMIERCTSMTKDHVLDLFIFKISYIGWAILSWITCGLVGLLYSTPYYNMASANVYAALKGSPIALADMDDTGVTRGLSSGELPPQLKPEMRKDPALVGIVGSYKGYTFPLEPNESVMIGRDATVASIALTVNTEKISRRHCTVRYNSQTEQYEVVDFSMNGVFVNGSRIAANTTVCLPRGTEIYLGSQTTNGFKLV